MSLEPRRVLNPCPACGGETVVATGEVYVDRLTGGASPVMVGCDCCAGTGGVEEDAILIEESDLDEMEEVL